MDLPRLVPYGDATAHKDIPADEWTGYLEAWNKLARIYYSLDPAEFSKVLKSGTLEPFLLSYIRAQATRKFDTSVPSSPEADALFKTVYLLTSRCLRSKTPPAPAALLQWDVLSDFAKAYGRKRASLVLNGTDSAHHLSAVSIGVAEASLSTVKKSLIKQMELRIQGDLRTVEEQLKRLNILVAAWPAAGAQILAGSDFLDALVGCYTVMNPPLRQIIITATYISLVSLTEPPAPRFSMLSDVLYSLRAAASDHKEGPLNANDSLVAELVSVTPILLVLKKRTEEADTATNRILPILRDLEAYKKPGSRIVVPEWRLKQARQKQNKGKGVAPPDPLEEAPTNNGSNTQLHPHKLSQILIVQDLFADLGSAFIAKLLDEYNDNTEQVIAHLLEDDLPPHLSSLDRSENLSDNAPSHHMAPHATPPLPPTSMPDQPPPETAADLPKRANVFDNDDLAQLSQRTAKVKLHFGKQKSGRTADDVIREGTDAPRKAAIMSALAAFDADDDERDDTYDAVDIGGAVEAETDDIDANDRILFAAFQNNIEVFDRDAVARRSDDRRRLREETNMSDEMLEGWALMLFQNPQRRRKLEAKVITGFNGNQNEIARTSYRQTDDDGEDGGEGSGRGGYRGGRGRGRGGNFHRPPRGNVDGPTGDKDTEAARRRKESNKGSRANHNRRDQRSRKMARGM